MAVQTHGRVCGFTEGKGAYRDLQKKTGLVIDAYFSATKLKWLLDNVPGARERAERGELLFGTVETWLIWKLTQGQVHVTDYSNASRTMMFNINTLKWDDEILKELDIPKSMLPKPMPSSCVYGEVNPVFSGVRFQSQERQETSRLRFLARPALGQEKPKIHTVQAVFC